MKTLLVFFKEEDKIFNEQSYSKICACFEAVGLSITGLEILSPFDEVCFKRRITEFKDTVDNLVVFESFNTSFDVKGVIAEVLEAPMVENDTARKFLDAIITSHGREYSDRCAYMPLDSTVIPNLNGALQGFIYEDREFTLSLLPSATEQAVVMCEKYLLPYLEGKVGVKRQKLTLKYFGEKAPLEQTLSNALDEYKGEFIYSLEENNKDFKVNLTFFKEDNSKDIIRGIVSTLKDNIYAEFDTSLSERLFDILRLKNLKISTAESFTGGRVISSIINNPGASQFVHEGLVSYSNSSKQKRLNVGEAELIKQGAVSSVVAYQMAKSLLMTGECNVSISTTGIAGPKSDDTEKPVGLAYIAVGTKTGVHTYKHLFKGDREEITETAKNTALFLAIKLLKNDRG